MRRSTLVVGLALALASGGTHQSISAQTEISARAASIRIGGRLHSQYAASSVASATNDFLFRRVRLIADLTVNDFLSGRVQPDFAGGKAALQDTYVLLAFSSGFRVYMGQFKRAFDLFEITSSNDLSLIERDGRVAGAGSCSGVGGVCSFSRLTERLGFAGRDQGVKIDGSSGRVSYEATVTNGTGINVADENDTKSYSGRLTVEASENVRISGQLASHDYVDPADENAYALGWSGDVEIGSWRDGLLIQGAVAGGDNWRSLDARDEAATFVTVQGVLSYYHPLSGQRIVGIEPLARFTMGDPDTSVDSDGGGVFTPGLMLYFGGRSKVGANLDIYSPQTGDTEYSFKIQTFLYF